MLRTMAVLLLALQTADGELARIDDWSKTQPDNGPGQIGVGDEFYRAAKKFPKDRQRFLDKANEWWAKGWPNLDEFWKDKTRANLRKIYAGPMAAPRPLRDWAQGQFVKAELSSAAAHSGGSSMRLAPQKINPGLAEAVTMTFKVKAAKDLAVSFWTYSDGTDGGETAVVHVYDAKGKEIATALFSFAADTPVWVKAEAKLPLPDGADTVKFIYLTSSKVGVIHVDDVSAKVDGKETLRDGGFEGR
jgi:hypothetical protein